LTTEATRSLEAVPGFSGEAEGDIKLKGNIGLLEICDN